MSHRQAGRWLLNAAFHPTREGAADEPLAPGAPRGFERAAYRILHAAVEEFSGELAGVIAKLYAARRSSFAT